MEFSKKYGLDYDNVEITVRNDAPTKFRQEVISLIVDTYTDLLFDSPYYSYIYECICYKIKEVPNIHILRNYDKAYAEATHLIHTCKWYYVYDIIEYFYSEIGNQYSEYGDRNYYEFYINKCLYLEGIGYIFKNGVIEVRGDYGFEDTVYTVQSVLEECKNTTALREIREAINDLSRRPEPDLTGAVHHAMGAVECLEKEHSKEEKLTLGEIIKKNKSSFPAPLDEAVSKLWGYSSNHARHITDGHAATFEEAELIVHISASLCTYLSRKFSSAETSEDISTL